MKIGFIFNSPFHITTVFQRPVGDAEAAVCYLAIELAKLGHDITIFSQSTNVLGAFDVRCRNINISNQTLNLDKAILEPDYDALIVKNNSPEFVVSLKKSLPNKVKIYLWTALDYNDSLNTGLSSAELINEIEGIICVSEWQRSRFFSKHTIPREKLHVIHYAMSPFYENLFVDGKEFLTVKSKIPTLAYVAKPLDGLEILLDTFADVENNYPGSTLSIYAGMHEYGAEHDKLENLYDIASHTKGVDHIGAISQVALAAQLRTHTMLAYPNIREETYDIGVMDALAAGLYVITSNLGALPEYCAEHGKWIAEAHLRTDSLDSFIGQVLSICQTQVHSPSAYYDFCYKQSVEMNKKHTWRIRAREWIHLLLPTLPEKIEPPETTI